MAQGIQQTKPVVAGVGGGIGMPLTNARVRKMRGTNVNNLLESNRSAMGGQPIWPNQQA